LLAHTDPSALLEDMAEYQSPAFKTWVKTAEQL
jgi:hypothetical protein